MEISFSYFWQEAGSNPMMMITVFFTLVLIFANGWTDAPNTIAACVTTKCLNAGAAIWMSVIFNFLGVLLMTQINSSVAATVSSMADFGGEARTAQMALCAALAAVAIYGTAASIFDIPISGSCSLIAGISGAAIAVQHGIGGIRMEEWVKVLSGLALSLLLGFGSGWIVCKVIVKIFHDKSRCKSSRFLKNGQIFGAAAMSFMHGAQDGQKFLGVLFLGIALGNGQNSTEGIGIPIWLMLLCGIAIAAGTAIGGKRMRKSVRMDRGKLEKYQGFAADLGGAFCLLCSSLLGIPVSTTHTKISAVMGVGAVKRTSAIQFTVIRNMMLTWVVTFLGCGLLSFFMTKILIDLFL